MTRAEVAELRPLLSRGTRLRFDRHSGKLVLLSPERGFLLNESAAEIVRRCDGMTSVAQIAAQLTTSGCTQNEVMDDVVELLRELERRRLLTLSERTP